MAFRLNILFFFFLGWMIATLIALTGLVTLSGTHHNSAGSNFTSIVPFLVMMLMPSFFCRHAGLRNRTSIGGIVVLSLVGWLVGLMFTPSVSMSRRTWLGEMADLPLVGHEWSIPCIIFSGIFAICGIILDPNTKSCNLAETESDPAAG